MDKMKELINDLEELSKLGQNAQLDNETIFRTISKLDEKYTGNENYSRTIDGVISNIGTDQKSTVILDYAISRLKEKKENLPLNKYYYDLGNTIYAKSNIEFTRANNIEYLVKTSGYREAIAYLSLVHKDKTDHYERALTNITNLYEKHGRNYEALLLYDKVLKISPAFGMALGSKALALEYYYRLSPYKSIVILNNIRTLFEDALKDRDLEQIGGPSSVKYFKEKLIKYNEYLEKIKYKPHKNELPEDISEYQRFTLKNNFLLNYDFGYYYDQHSLIDSFFPSFIERIDEKKTQKSQVMSEKIYYSFQIFNQLLEDYTTSRYNFFQALNLVGDVFDNKVNYVYTFDYTKHSLKYGILKSVFVSLYSCLDKIAHLIKYYYGSSDNYNDDIYFDWLTTDEFREIIIKQNSYQLLALLSLSLDFKPGYIYYKLNQKRNRITHSFLSVYTENANHSNLDDSEITETMLIEYITDLFVIVKAAIMYSVLAIRYSNKDNKIIELQATFQKDIFS